MIPKTIHYIWFGEKQKPDKVLECIESWKKYCPDYTIIEWNESNYDISQSQFAYEAMLEGKWAFVSDYARLDIIYKHGGIYLDTDVELLKSLDPLMSDKAFMGFEDGKSVSSGLGFGSVKGFHLIKEMRDLYDGIRFKLDDGTLNTVACPVYTTEFLTQKGLIQDNTQQTIDGMVIYPSEYFSPKMPGYSKLKLTDNTYSIHHYDMSWVDNPSKLYKLKLTVSPLLQVIRGFLVKLIGEERFKKLRGTYTGNVEESI